MKALRAEGPSRRTARRRSRAVARMLLVLLAIQCAQAFASGSSMEDRIADVMVWVVIIVAPLLGLIVFWTVHVWPERVAEARDHPQKDAIHALCLLSLAFGGLLWPLAMLWAYMKPLRFQVAQPDTRPDPHAGPHAGPQPIVAPGDATADPHFDGAIDAARPGAAAPSHRT